MGSRPGDVTGNGAGGRDGSGGRDSAGGEPGSDHRPSPLRTFDEALAGGSARSAGSSGVQWWKRRSVFVSLMVAAVVAATVLTDLPQHASLALQASDDVSTMKTVNGYLNSCSYAVKQTFTIYRDERAHSLSPSDRGEVPGLLSGDEAACTFTNDDIYELSSVEVPGTKAERDLQRLVSVVTTWATSDAAAAIGAIETLSSSPSNAKARGRLSKAEKNMTSDRKRAVTDLREAESILDAKLPAVNIPTVTACLADRASCAT